MSQEGPTRAPRGAQSRNHWKTTILSAFCVQRQQPPRGTQQPPRRSPQGPKEAPRGTKRRPSSPSKSQEAPKEAPRATKRPTRWDKKVPRELQEASRAEIIEKPPYCQHFFIKSLKTTILSAFSRTGRAVGAQPGATKKCSKRTRPHRGWDTSGVQNLVFMNIDPHQTL